MESREPSSGLQHDHSSDSCSCYDGDDLSDMSFYRSRIVMLPSSRVNLSEELNPTIWKELAKEALTYYPDTKGLKLEICGEVTIAKHYLHETLYGFHLAFEATSQDGDLKMVLAEVFQEKYHGSCFIKFCTVMDMDPNDPGVVKGCCACPEAILHPKGVVFFQYPNPEVFY